MNTNILTKLGMKNIVNLIKKGFCPSCLRKVDSNKFKTNQSKKEFKISGLCQSCQDEMFN